MTFFRAMVHKHQQVAFKLTLLGYPEGLSPNFDPSTGFSLHCHASVNTFHGHSTHFLVCGTALNTSVAAYLALWPLWVYLQWWTRALNQSWYTMRKMFHKIALKLKPAQVSTFLRVWTLIKWISPYSGLCSLGNTGGYSSSCTIRFYELMPTFAFTLTNSHS